MPKHAGHGRERLGATRPTRGHSSRVSWPGHAAVAARHYRLPDVSWICSPLQHGVSSVSCGRPSSSRGCTAHTPQEVVHHVSPTVVEFEDPPGVTGDGFPSGGTYRARGVMFYDAPPGKFASGGTATCTLPEADAALCVAILNDFVQRYSTYANGL